MPPLRWELRSGKHRHEDTTAPEGSIRRVVVSVSVASRERKRRTQRLRQTKNCLARITVTLILLIFYRYKVNMSITRFCIHNKDPPPIFLLIFVLSSFRAHIFFQFVSSNPVKPRSEIKPNDAAAFNKSKMPVMSTFTDSPVAFPAIEETEQQDLRELSRRLRRIKRKLFLRHVISQLSPEELHQFKPVPLMRGLSNDEESSLGSNTSSSSLQSGTEKSTDISLCPHFRSTNKLAAPSQHAMTIEVLPKFNKAKAA